MKDHPDAQLNLFEWDGPPPPKVYFLHLEKCTGRSLRPTETLKFNVWFDGQLIVESHRTPMFAACRVLAALGLTGTATFIRPDGTLSMSMDIAKGANSTVTESNSGPRITKYVPFTKGMVVGGDDGEGKP